MEKAKLAENTKKRPKIDFDKITIKNDLMFHFVMSDKEICKGVVSRLLGIEIEDIEYPELQKDIQSTYNSRGIRLDVYVKTKDGTKTIDVEMQRQSEPNLELRSRYYQSMIDSDSITKGVEIDLLNESYVIFICPFDYFDLKQSVYWFETYCRDNKDLKLQDKKATIIYNTRAFRAEKDPELKALLNYFDNNQITSDFCSSLDNKVVAVRHSGKFRRDYSDMDLFAYDNRMEGQKEKTTEIVIEMIKKGFSFEVIADIVKLSVEQIKQIAEKAEIAE